ncbi:MAG: hypothetical protein RID07_07045 [Lacipirellulaceae bacterium]
MACSYCFAKARGGFRGDPRIQLVNSGAFRKRLKRAAEGRGRGAFEEFLQRRIPIQLGGMTDPFSISSVETQCINDLLGVLNEFDYPTIISTKGRFCDLKSVRNLLSVGNYYVRVSIGASLFDKNAVEPGTPSVCESLEIVSMLAEADIPTCVRLQPIFPDAEEQALFLGIAAKNAGARAVSLEYLKVPEDRSTHQFRQLDRLYRGRLRSIFESEGISTDGREFSLSLERRIRGLKVLKKELNRIGVRVGIAENELLHYGDLAGCCNGGSEVLRGAEDFQYNTSAVLRRRVARSIAINEFADFWKPTSPVARHFNSHSRFGLKGLDATWENFFKRRWNDLRSKFNPTFFHGVTFDGANDEDGNLIYNYVPDTGWGGMVQEPVRSGTTRSPTR